MNDDSQVARSAPYSVAVIGAATAGSEIAHRLAARGAHVAVFEQNSRPYGKIEDGLPRWHDHLRLKEYQRIRERLSHPGIDLVPATAIGRDVDFGALVEEWGFTAVVLANGAWRDRPLPVEDAERFVGKGLLYQNPFIHWFNHCEEADYDGPRYEITPDTLVVGGGLASIDVAKAVMLETVRTLLAARGIEIDLVQLEAKGIPSILAAHDLRFEDLGIPKCRLVYRRRIEDMPVVQAPEGADEARMEKVRQGRARMIAKASEKYCFDVEQLVAPESLWIEDDRVVGLHLRRTAMVDGKLVSTEDTLSMRAALVVSSIGSIPEPIDGIEMKGELYRFLDWDLGRLERFPTVFAAGNVVTGKGNIIASRKHAEHVAHDLVEHYLGIGEGEADVAPPGRERAALAADAIQRFLDTRAPMDEGTREQLAARVRERQRAVGYHGNLEDWLKKVTPPDLG